MRERLRPDPIEFPPLDGGIRLENLLVLGVSELHTLSSAFCLFAIGPPISSSPGIFAMNCEDVQRHSELRYHFPFYPYGAVKSPFCIDLRQRTLQ
jgi:hypothetical protein